MSLREVGDVLLQVGSAGLLGVTEEGNVGAGITSEFLGEEVLQPLGEVGERVLSEAGRVLNPNRDLLEQQVQDQRQALVQEEESLVREREEELLEQFRTARTASRAASRSQGIRRTPPRTQARSVLGRDESVFLGL